MWLQVHLVHVRWAVPQPQVICFWFGWPKISLTDLTVHEQITTTRPSGLTFTSFKSHLRWDVLPSQQPFVKPRSLYSDSWIKNLSEDHMPFCVTISVTHHSEQAHISWHSSVTKTARHTRAILPDKRIPLTDCQPPSHHPGPLRKAWDSSNFTEQRHKTL